jgi:ABC-type nitrate/sulfonate/bicarbonate transport system substrate-binding protein
MKNRSRMILWTILITASLAACQSGANGTATTLDQPEELSLMLDWVPNTNHTGIFVAQSQGYFKDAGLNVTIIEPGEVYAEQAVSAGAADIGISFQEQVTIARSEGIPLVSIAAILQHNTSTFAARGALDVSSPSDWEGLRYGAFGSPFEEPTLRMLMQCAGADFNALEIVDTGYTDPLALLSEARIDLAWIFYGWQGLQAEQQGLDLDLVMMNDWFDCIPDYYTPIFITSEAMIQDQPEIVRSFLLAVSRGYQFAIEDPEASAQILLQVAPELDPELVLISQSWISSRYQAEAPRWGEQQVGVWEAYAEWMAANGIIAQPIAAEAA